MVILYDRIEELLLFNSHHTLASFSFSGFQEPVWAWSQIAAAATETEIGLDWCQGVPKLIHLTCNWSSDVFLLSKLSLQCLNDFLFTLLLYIGEAVSISVARTLKILSLVEGWCPLGCLGTWSKDTLAYVLSVVLNFDEWIFLVVDMLRLLAFVVFRNSVL